MRHGRLPRVKEADLDRAEGWFEKCGDLIVFFARMVPLARSIVSIPAGAARMPLGRFALLTTAGSALWNALLTGAGYLLGANWSRVGGWVGAYSNAVLAASALIVLALALRWWLRRKRAR